jgi:UDP-N-acetyl-D-mannosaminuronic acid dehydrogenase
MEKISIVGLGYIGLPTAILAAQNGYQVFGFDVDQEKIDKINFGDPTIVEPEITERLLAVIASKKFKAHSQLQEADCFVVAVPTPFIKNTDPKEADLSFVFAAAKNIAKVLEPNNLVILESTIPVGATEQMSKILEQESGLKLGVDFFVAHCPERVLPGRVFYELVNNDRVIGGMCEHSAQRAKDFYSKFVKGKLFLTDDKTAEMVKLVENSSRDVQIAFANSVAAMAQKVGINPWNVIELANRHPRVNILNPGCGVGGHCIAVDPWFLVQTFPDETKLLSTARVVNDQKPFKVIKDVLKECECLKTKGIKTPKVLALGLTFKPDIDDMRESPSLKIAQELNAKKEELELLICEPNMQNFDLQKLGFSNTLDLTNGLDQADIVLILVKHKEFMQINNLNLNNKIIIDTCGLVRDDGVSFVSFDTFAGTNTQDERIL